MHGYILDFYCHEAGLAVELDGGGHNDEEQRLYDEERTKILEAAGIHVIRFWNNDVLKSTEIVLEKLYAYLEEGTARIKSSPLIRPSATFSLREKGR